MCHKSLRVQSVALAESPHANRILGVKTAENYATGFRAYVRSSELANPSVEAVESHPRQGLPNFFAKLKQGKDVRIAYFGGSITAQDQQFSFWLVWEVWCPPFRVSDATWDHPSFVPFVPFVPKSELLRN